ncbi:mediator of RNA polymerase II transcription subunit 11 isoform X3 [Malania oleifera]|uniref:mediator of RNA polymerase II transcription subunit 11 isoform X3 n=1 Tax=Malania oleifera TaxID=397392 RepID=UPI0025ADB817|nr:mediator of RNA polymerase II transcription subunit 11 isoform X3 [Malania oleifera]
MDSQTQSTSLQRLQNVEKRIVRVLELAGGVMDELSNPIGPRKEMVNSHCGEFMQLIKEIRRIKLRVFEAGLDRVLFRDPRVIELSELGVGFIGITFL